MRKERVSVKGGEKGQVTGVGKKGGGGHLKKQFYRRYGLKGRGGKKTGPRVGGGTHFPEQSPIVGRGKHPRDLLHGDWGGLNEEDGGKGGKKSGKKTQPSKTFWGKYGGFCTLRRRRKRPK